MPTLTILAMADIHLRFKEFDPEALPRAGLVLIAGDLTNDGVMESEPLSPAFLDWLRREGRSPEEFQPEESEVEMARSWLTRLATRYPVLWIPGNHDIGIDNATFADIPNCTCILDQTIEFGGLTIHGVSMSPGDEYLARRWDYMTNDPKAEWAAYDFEPVDIVLSHCPPYGGRTDQSVGATGDAWLHFGSSALSDYIELQSPRLVICGHVHEAERYELIGRTEVHNCAERWLTIKIDTPN